MRLQPLEDVRRTMTRTGMPEATFQFVQGKVEDTLRRVELPRQIALLRLDTDWYESTRVELEVHRSHRGRGPAVASGWMVLEVG